MTDTKSKSSDEVPSKADAAKKGADTQSTKPAPPKMPPPKAAKVAPVAEPVEVKPSGPPHPGAPPNAGSADDPTGEKFVAWVKADMVHKQSQH